METTQIQDVIDLVPASWLTQESRSAPELTSMNLKEHNELTESYSDSYTSTCATTTTTSDEYQRMYNAQSTLLQSQNFYDQSSVDLNSSNCDYEVLSIQQQHASFSSGSTEFLGFSGRRSAQECSDAICSTINTSQLVDYIKDNPIDYGDYSSSLSLPKLPKKVGFSESITKVETDTLIKSGSQPSSIEDEQQNQIEPQIQVQEPLEPLKEQQQQQQQQEKEEIPPPQSTEQPKLEPPFDRKSITPSPSIIYNATPKEWKSLMVQALTTASDKPFTITDLPDAAVNDSTYESYEQTSRIVQFTETKQSEEVQSVLIEKIDDEQTNVDQSIEKCEEQQPKTWQSVTSHFIASSGETKEWSKPIYEDVPLPEETTPYFPPNIPLLPIEKHEPLRTKSPFVDALTVAPLRPFTPFENDVISQIEGLPRAPPDATLADALTTAPSQPITKLNPDLPDETECEERIRLEREKQEKQAAEVRALISKTVDEELSKKCKSFAPLQGYRRVDPFNPPSSSYNHSSHCQSRSSSVCTENVDKTKKTSIDIIDQTQTNTINVTTNKACHSQSSRNTKKSTAFPPPLGTPVKQYVQSGLQSPKTIPKYQRQWFNLPSQSPIRTPEPPELKENVPLAFIDAPHEKTESVSKPIAITISASTSTSTATVAATTECVKAESTTVVDVQKTITTAESSSLSSESASTVATVATVVPTLPVNRVAPITMTFQSLDPKDLIEPVRSSTPSLINKPPPLVPYYQQNLVCEYYGAPNSFTFDPTKRTPSPRPDAMKPYAQGPPPSVLKIQAPRITTPDSLELSASIGVPTVASQSGAQLLDASKQGYSTASQSFIKKPEVFHREQKGDLNIQTHTTGSESNAAKKSDIQSSATYQVGNVQVQQNRRVVEEFEHTQKSSTTEIHTSSSGRSELEQKIANGVISSEYLTELPYGKGFVARQARRLSETPQSNNNVVASYRFPHTTLDTTESGFPITSKPIDPPKPATIQSNEPIIQSNVKSLTKTIAPKTLPFPLPKTPQRLSPIPQRTCFSPQRTSPVPQKISFPPPIDVAAYDEQFSSSSQCSNQLATASLTTQYQSSSAYQSLTTAGSGPSAFLPNPNYGSSTTPKPISSTSIPPGSKPPILTTTNYNKNQNTVSVSDPTPASAGPSSNKNLTTTTPKRGRGVLNASVPPGGRIPKCGCCNAQIR